MATLTDLINNLNGALTVDIEDRGSMRNHFLRGEIPTQDHFHAFINSGTNLVDDGLFKTTDTPLCILAPSSDTALPVLHFYGDASTEPAWELGIEGGHLRFTTPADGTNRLTINSNGNVGIGTTAASHRLTVEGTADIAKFKSPLSSNSRISIENDVNAMNIGIGATAPTDGFAYIWSRNTKFFIGSDGSPHFTIRGDLGGNVGIGTTSPDAKLDVAGAIKYTGSYAGTILYGHTNESGTPDSDGFRIRYANSYFGVSSDALVFEKTDGHQNSPDGGIVFANTGNDGIVESAMVIRGNGNVGIGTTNPQEKLDVNGIVSSNNGGFKLVGGLNSHMNIDGAFYRYLGDGGQVYITVDDNLYIRHMLDGNIKFRFLTSNGQAYKSSGAGSWAAYSDKRLKKNIENFSDGLREIRQLTPKKFQFTGDGGMEKDLEQVGVIAQDIREVLPYTVSVRPGKMKETDKEEVDLLDFDPSALTYVLINAVKELDSQLIALKKEVTALKKKTGA